VKPNPPDSPDSIFKRSFVGEMPLRVSFPLTIMTLVVLGATIIFVHDSLPSRYQDIVGLIWAAFAGAWLVVIFAWRSARQTYVYNEDKWLASLPFPFDAEGYKDMLHRKGLRGSCLVIVETNAAETKTTEQIAAALRGPRKEKVYECGAGIFEVHSPFFDTTTDSEEYLEYSNVHLHRWFKGYVNDVLVPLHAVGILKYVRAESKDGRRAKLP